MSRSGDLLERRRVEIGLSQERFAARIAVHKSTYQDYITKGSIPRPRQALHIATHAFDTEIASNEYLLAIEKDNQQKLPEKERLRLERDLQHAKALFIAASIVCPVNHPVTGRRDLFIEISVTAKKDGREFLKLSEYDGMRIKTAKGHFDSNRTAEQEVMEFEGVCERYKISPEAFLSYLRTEIMMHRWFTPQNYITDEHTLLHAGQIAYLQSLTSQIQKNMNEEHIKKTQYAINEILQQEFIGKRLSEKRIILISIVGKVLKYFNK